MPNSPFGQIGNYRLVEGVTQSISATTFALNSAFTYQSSGAGIIWAFIPQVSGEVEEFRWYVDGFVGTWSLTDTEVQLRVVQSTGTQLLPGTTLANGGPHSFPIASGVGWKAAAFNAPRPTVVAGSTYFMVLGDSDGNSSNHMRVLTGASLGNIGGTTGATSTNGFSTAGTLFSSARPGVCAIKIGGVWHYGTVIVSMSTRASSSVPRGVRLRFASRTKLLGVACFTDWGMPGLRWSVFRSDQLPDDTPIFDIAAATAPADYNQQGFSSRFFPSPPTLEKDTTYYLVLRPTSALTVPRELSIGTGADDVIRAGMALGGFGCIVDKHATNNEWVVQTNLGSAIVPIVVGEAEAGGGGSPRMRAGTGVIG